MNFDNKYLFFIFFNTNKCAIFFVFTVDMMCVKCFFVKYNISREFPGNWFSIFYFSRNLKCGKTETLDTTNFAEKATKSSTKL